MTHKYLAFVLPIFHLAIIKFKNLYIFFNLPLTVIGKPLKTVGITFTQYLYMNLANTLFSLLILVLVLNPKRGRYCV
jgi:hypothetical protein